MILKDYFFPNVLSPYMSTLASPDDRLPPTPSNAYSVGQKYSTLDNKIASAADESDVQMIFLDGEAFIVVRSSVNLRSHYAAKS